MRRQRNGGKYSRESKVKIRRIREDKISCEASQKQKARRAELCVFSFKHTQLLLSCCRNPAKANDMLTAEDGPSSASSPLWRSHHLWGLLIVKQRRQRRWRVPPIWFATDCHPRRRWARCGATGQEERRREESKLSFLQGTPRWQRGRQRKMGRKGGRLGSLPAQNTGNPYTHTYTHILDSSLALACRYDATVIHDS